MRRRSVLSIALALAGAALVATAAPAAAATFSRCGADVLCGRVSVPLDRSGGTPGTISLLVERTRPRGTATLPPLLALAGGPGQAAVPARRDFALLMAPVLGRRELVVFDQRGTGRSGLLRCPALERSTAVDQSGPTAECARDLGPARAFYTTRDSVEDIEAVRMELGVDRLALYGGSYGTKVALAYAVAHPEHVERLVLDSTVPLTGPDPFARPTFAALPRVLRALCARRACSGITADPVGDTAALAQRLAAHPLRGSVFGPRGQRIRAGMVESNLFDLLVAGDLDPTLRAAAPAAIVAALRGDGAPVLRLARRASQVDGPADPRQLSAGLFVATMCEESPFPWARGASRDERLAASQAVLDATPAEALLPFDRPTALIDSVAQLCLDWPQAPEAPALATGPAPTAPTLVYSGTQDVRTPFSEAQTVAGGLPDVRLVTVSGVGHDVLGGSLSDCPLLQLDRFFAGRAVAARCNGLATGDSFLSSVAGLFSPRVYPVPPASLRQLLPARGLPGQRGRTATAALLTFVDAFPTVLSTVLVQDPALIERGGVHVGGLRGGHYTLRGDRLVLDRVVYVPGVVVSGTIRFVGSAGLDARLRITGGAAAHGTVSIDQRLAMHGRLGGRDFKVPAPTRLARAGGAPDLGARLATAPALRRPDRLARLARLAARLRAR